MGACVLVLEIVKTTGKTIMTDIGCM